MAHPADKPQREEEPESGLPIFSFEIPNPFFEGRNRVYVIGSDPPTLVDTGVATAKAFAALVDGLAEGGLSPCDIGRVILTHKHIDHIGNAWRIQRESGAEIFIHQEERHAVVDVDPGGGRFADLVRQKLQDWNVPETATPKPSSPTRIHWEIESAAATGLHDGDRVDLGTGELKVIHTPGHTMGSICLKLGSYLFTGDHVLEHLSPNVGGGDLRNRGLLKHYLSSLQRIRDMAGDLVQAMPGHGGPFSGLTERCDALQQHHHERLDKTVEILGENGPQTVYDVACRLFGEMVDFHVVLGAAEAHAHLEHLLDGGRIESDGQRFRLA